MPRGPYHLPPFASAGVPIAVVICRSQSTRKLHLGLKYRVSGQDRALHLGWQDQVWDAWPWTELWASPAADVSRLRVAAALCRTVWLEYSRTRQMESGLRWGGTHFDGSGRVLLGPDAIGLTCATFVMAVFKTAGIDLVDEDDWPTRTEEALAFAARVSVSDLEVGARLEGEALAGAKRITPDEVMGPCTLDAVPGRFAETRTAADHVLTGLVQS